ncbi:ABC transporter permease [Lapillicoccus jejuensis]|uniref:Peptide/nickel transport system permease protein n=1 Tax=Lapillicoccus jejuensis TaxID=402171 RepID=A0A542E6I9_9MICO|nr:ABC transporter permease [Lapillicoccus jejuensis]TQJ10950.1 peptide/nickel transport system permease protein [Lapillicoccus jejuensis]
MIVYIARRIALAVSVVLVTLVATFLLFFAGPADPAQSMCGELRCSATKLVEIRHSMGLDRPLPQQFTEYFKGLFVGREITDGGTVKECTAPCLGYSFRYHLDVREMVFDRVPTTFVLAVMSMVIFLAIGVTLGVYTAQRRGSGLDRFVVGFSQVFGAIPYYVVALLASLYLVVLNPVLPRSASLSDGVGPWLIGMLAPALILGLVYSTSYVRYTRAQMVDTLAQDYVRTARSKGISARAVTYRHALRGALSPVLTVLGLDMAGLLAGTLITEKIFGIDGVGKLSIDALGLDDLPVIMGTVLLSAVIVVVLNLVVDVLYSVVDPRVRLA